jgi:ATP-dependent exoDNAse (exonuclease V) beta subunit
MSLNVYKSSAGSGKTYTLVLEYLGLVLKQPSLFRKILAVTFTNKAANEMKARVIKSLWVLADSSAQDVKLRDSLISNLKSRYALEEETITENALIVFSNILHYYSDFSISTIDSFSHRLVRTFTRDLELPPQFEVELDAGQLAQVVSDILMSRVGVDDFITNTILNFAMLKMEDESDWQIEYQLKMFIMKLMKEDAFLQNRYSIPLTENDFVEIRELIPIEIKQTENNIKGIADRMLELLASQQISIFDLNGKSRGIGPVIEKLSKKRIADVFDQKLIHNYFSGEKSLIGDNANFQLKASFAIIESEMYNALALLNSIYESDYKRYVLLNLLNRNIYSFSLSAQITSIMLEIGTEKQLVHISEFNKSIASLLQKVAVPFIYERLGERFSHFLLDEFQDTSVLQWQNFLPLIENSLASGNLNLIVGDGKQSIYRFRSGEVEQFLCLPAVFKKEGNENLYQSEEVLKLHYNQIDLNTNYRSAAGIVEMNNGFFDFVRTFLPENLQSVYDNQSQKAIKTIDDGLTTFTFLEKLKDKKQDLQQYLDSILDLVNQLISEGYQFRDIAILTRSNKNGNEVARYLANNNIHVVSSDSLLLNSSIKVRLLVNVMMFYLQPEDRINRTELLWNLTEIEETDENQFSILLNDLGSLSETEQISEFQRMLTTEMFHTPGLSVYDFFESLVRLLNFDQNADPFIQFFLDEVYRFQVKERKGATEFLEFWEINKENISVVVPDTTNAVAVMTIHKAKGLEFPVVIFPFADMKLNLSKLGDKWLDLRAENIGKLESCIIGLSKQLQNTRFNAVYDEEVSKAKLDLMNLLYVVMTRPIDRLYVFAPKPDDKESFSCPWFFKAWLEHKGFWDADKTVYEIGVSNTLKVTPDCVSASDSVVKFISTDWKSKLYLAKESGPFSSDLDNQSAVVWGSLTHQLLSEILFESDFEHVIKKYLETGLFNNIQAEKIEKQVLDLLNHPQLKSYYSENKQVKTEAEILGDDGKVYRIDRYVKTDEEVILIEYKTGKLDAIHEKQILRYVNQLENIENLPVKGMLVYLGDEVLIKEVS